MDRKVLYSKIRKYKLEDEIKKVYGKNFTQVKSDELEVLISRHESQEVVPTKKEKTECTDCITKRLVEVLQKKRILLNSEVDYILG